MEEKGGRKEGRKEERKEGKEKGGRKEEKAKGKTDEIQERMKEMRNEEETGVSWGERAREGHEGRERTIKVENTGEKEKMED